MKIVTCIKQVPGSSNVKIDEVTGVLIRDGKNTKMNPYDLYALETALRIKESVNDCTITTITIVIIPINVLCEKRTITAAIPPIYGPINGIKSVIPQSKPNNNGAFNPNIAKPTASQTNTIEATSNIPLTYFLTSVAI